MVHARTPKKTRSQPRLSSQRIRDATLQLIEAEGLEAFSTRKLGQALGVEAMAIYWYFPSKDELLGAVVDELISKITVSAGAGPDASVELVDVVREFAHGYRKLAHAYPNAFPLLATRRFATEGTYHFLEDLFLLAKREGLAARTTARFYQLVVSYSTGVGLSELAGRRASAEETKESKAARAQHPRLQEVWEWLEAKHYDDAFSFGLEILLSEIAQAADQTKRRKKTRTNKPEARRAKAKKALA